MSKKIIALDAMGGDNAPQIVVAGANIARRRHPDVKFLLFGDEAKIAPLVSKQRGLSEFVEIRHASEKVQPEDKPSQIVRSGQETSMWKAITSVKDGESDGIVSAGNTGALLAMAMLVLRRLDGIDRPAIASFFPTQRGETVMLDLGANVLDLNVAILDLQGRTLQSTNWSGQTSGQRTLDLTALAPGHYTVRLTDGTGQWRLPVVRH